MKTTTNELLRNFWSAAITMAVILFGAWIVAQVI